MNCVSLASPISILGHVVIRVGTASSASSPENCKMREDLIGFPAQGVFDASESLCLLAISRHYMM
jgi:hypothetical protein